MAQPDKRKRRILRSLTVDEVSGVDRAAQAPAQALLRKRAPAGNDAAELSKHGYDRPMLTTEQDGHQHVLDDCGQGGETSWTRGEGEEQGHSHAWVRMLDGKLVIGAADGHTHDVIPMTATLAVTKSATQPGGVQPKETEMTQPKIETPADANAEAVQKSIRDLTSRAERAEAIMKLSADERGLFDTMDAKGQGEFLAKSAPERAQLVVSSKDSNRVVYKSLSGDEYRASDDQRLVKMARERDEEKQRTEKALNDLAMERLTKRAEAELAHCPGTPAERAGILKALEGVAGAEAFLKAADASLAKAFKPTGTTGGATAGNELLKAEDRLEVLAKAHVAANPSVSIEKARVIVLESPEGQKLYAESDASRAPTAE